ncbi:histidine phosphatase family protein [Actinomadura sp. HBU206391]|uniref:histidine phosphatase family protein n=1 Tax=Actinomadura sp. HBU206391 TaxID=2731692 RepID=UPI00164EF808|nr:histidine phosphatase family protein [Actinomadura sp. HBU206391]MBC6463540.1 histidine phosphatase family protein [Actinomadura sp. HBU206391]
MTTTLYLVRHGQTVWHAENRYAGVSDVALTATGQEQADRLGRWAEKSGLDAVWCSPLSRARATAAPAASALGLALRVDNDLREVDFGAAEGHTLAELDPAVVAAFRADPVLGSFPGAEDPRSAAGRAVIALDRIAARHPGERVLVVAHNTLLRLVLCSLLEIPLSRYRSAFPQVRNCALTELRHDGTSAALLAYNVPLPE